MTVALPEVSPGGRGLLLGGRVGWERQLVGLLGRSPRW